MRPLAAADMLWVWEWGTRRHPVDRALLILSAAYPERTADELASLTVGQRDGDLLATRAATLGDKLDNYAVCPECHGELQFSLKVSDLYDASQSNDSQAPFQFEVDGFCLQLKCLNSQDLADAARTGAPQKAHRLLLQRCVVDAHHDGQPVPADHLPEQVTNAVTAEVAKRDPQADIEIDLNCPDCGHQWPLELDIAAYFWDEIANRAPQLLHDVHRLARAYGWPEADILAMSPVRREAYLRMVG